jgi:hypothetical protein
VTNVAFAVHSRPWEAAAASWTGPRTWRLTVRSNSAFGRKPYLWRSPCEHRGTSRPSQHPAPAIPSLKPGSLAPHDCSPRESRATWRRHK